MTQRWFRGVVLVGGIAGVVVAACGGTPETRQAGAAVAGLAGRAPPGAPADSLLAGDAVTAFGVDLFDVVAAEMQSGENLVVSPLSVAVALAMLEPGVVGAAQGELRRVLRVGDAGEFHHSMSTLEQRLESRTPQSFDDDGDPGELSVRVVNTAYLQEGYPFEPAYLDAIGTNYGAALYEVDFGPDPDAVAAEINAAVAEVTNNRITDLVGPGVFAEDTVLALVNALYLQASWVDTFDDTQTTDAPFTLLDGSQITVPLMSGQSGSSATGDGWIGATKMLVGQLSVQFILPDPGRFDEIAGNLDAVYADYETNRTSGAELAVPRFETRTRIDLEQSFRALGLAGLFDPGNLLAVANDPLLALNAALHQVFVAFDEDGVEAAAATVLSAVGTGGPSVPPVPVVLDRPFLFRIVDQESGASLFLGRIMNPTR